MQLVTDSQFQTTQTEVSTNTPFALPISTSEYNYGILKLVTPPAPSDTDTSQHIHFIASIDRSGSMAESASSSNPTSKIGFLKDTLKNMIRWFSEQEDRTFYITFITFDNLIEIPIEYQVVTKERVNELISIVDNIFPRNTTNIELALQTAQTIFTKYAKDGLVQSQIFMTDGEITNGSNDIDILKGLIDENYFQSFIGYGTSHNDNLLTLLSTARKSNYYFVESVENTGMVYGEIINNVVNNMIDNVKITMSGNTDIEIYNFKKNTWQKALDIGSMPADITKIYHIRYKWIYHGPSRRLLSSAPPLKLPFKLEYIYNDDMVEIEDSIIVNPRTTDRFDDFHGRVAEKYMWRLKTLEYLYLSTYEHIDQNELKTFLSNMEEFIERFNLTDDAFMKTICDDIYIIIRSHNSQLANMYINARQNSQGYQRAYNTTDISELTQNQNYNDYQQSYGQSMDDYDDVANDALPDEDEYYQLSNNTTTSYTNSSQAAIMRNLSQCY
jgi:hypothetical protein